MLRQINDVVDFSSVLEELKNKYCHDNGRNAVAPNLCLNVFAQFMPSGSNHPSYVAEQALSLFLIV